jgi:pimeloyl-ACP methyl ester carboxylesterase
VIKALGGRFRCITTSLLGYGQTAERRLERNPSVEFEAEILERAIAKASAGGGAVHLVGHSFGGSVALLVAMRKRVPIASLTVLEAPVPAILRHCGEDAHYRAFRDMTDAYFDDWHGGDRKAIRTMIDFYGGEGTWAAWPDRVQAYAVETTPVNMLDWGCAYDHPLSPEMLADIDVPVVVAVGAQSHRAISRANGLVAMSIEGATFKTIGGAAHFMISTHSAQVAEVIAAHVLGETSPRAEVRVALQPERLQAATACCCD